MTYGRKYLFIVKQEISTVTEVTAKDYPAENHLKNCSREMDRVDSLVHRK